ncbi:hypothetical protein FIBSPDRAFT_951412 [Athelia psychrophila]|uniref:Uncharacterized protein n=1 Tax=Athelia psychrophila TaxID=1759441 RepID=A0A166MKX6_9AGAM|nr:hypothetical protein FIBSPDRAFT_951412 [Fibularhizoctonia sp. CBS 109695]
MTLSIHSDYTSSISTNLPPHTVSKHEAMFYYSGISLSPPKLVYCTGSLKALWVKPVGPEAQPKLKRVHGVYGHKLNDIWSDMGPCVLSNLNTTVNICGPLTLALGLAIATTDRPDTQGTMELYFTEGGQSDKLMGLTCHHMLFKTDTKHNVEYKFRGAGVPHKYVCLLSLRCFEGLLTSIKVCISCHGIMVDIYGRDIVKLKARVKGDVNKDVAEAKKELKKTHSLLEDANVAIEELKKFYATVKKNWGNPKQCTISHIHYSSTLISKFKNMFVGNFVDLGTKIPSDKFTLMMYPHEDSPTTFKYPGGCLLPLRGMISEQLMHTPDIMHTPNMLDHNNNTCLLVSKKLCDRGTS